jgi:hypothetical protein
VDEDVERREKGDESSRDMRRENRTQDMDIVDYEHDIRKSKK